MGEYNGPALHTYEPDKDGRCEGGWVASDGGWHICRSTQRSSVLHDDPEAAFRERHWHGGGDCMCFEADDGPSYHQAMEAFVRGLPVEVVMVEHGKEI